MNESNDWNQYRRHLKIGEILIRQKKLTIEQLGDALEKQKDDKTPIGEVLIRMGVITTTDLLKALDLQVNIDRLLHKKSSEFNDQNEAEGTI